MIIQTSLIPAGFLIYKLNPRYGIAHLTLIITLHEITHTEGDLLQTNHYRTVNRNTTPLNSQTVDKKNNSDMSLLRS